MRFDLNSSIPLIYNQFNYLIMKKYISIILLFFTASIIQAQSDQEEVDLMQSIFGMDKKEVVAGYVQFSPAQEEAFWELYDEYEAKRQTLGQERVVLLRQYFDEHEAMGSAEADAWTKKVITLQQKTDKLISSYYGKILKISDGVVATQFYQIENYVLGEIRAAILETIPFIEK